MPRSKKAIQKKDQYRAVANCQRKIKRLQNENKTIAKKYKRVSKRYERLSKQKSASDNQNEKPETHGAEWGRTFRVLFSAFPD